jgi:starvation-inducible DNA-binding protein
MQMEKTNRDISEIGSLIGRMEDSDLSQELSYMHEDLQDAFDARGDNKSLKADTVYAEGSGLVDGLRDLLSDVVAFYLESHGAHWNVVGDDFKQYHDLFGEIYEDVHGSVDPLAENIRKLNATAPFDLRDIASDPALNNASGAVNPEDLCEELYASNSVLLMKILSCFNMATEAGEQGIANFLAERQDAHKKWAWQLSASLDERGEQTEVAEAAESPELELDMSKSAKYSEDQARDGSGRFGSGGGGGSSDPRADSATNPDVRVDQAATYLHDEYDRSEGDSRGAVMNAQDILDGHEQAGTASAPELAYARTFVLAARDINAHLAESRPVSLGQLQRDRAFFGKKQDTLSRMMDRLQDSPIGDDLRGAADDLSKSMDNVLDMHSSLEAALANKSLKRPNTDESAQPVIRLAIKAGKTTERKAADPDEVKKQMRAFARDLAIKSVRK